MRRLAIVVLALVVSIPAFAWDSNYLKKKPTAGGGGGGPTYLIDTDFNATETPTGWAVQSGSPNFDYTTSPAPLEGAQSLGMPTDAQTMTTFTATDDIYIIFRAQWPALPGVNVGPFRVLGTGAGGEVARMLINSNGSISVQAAGGTEQFSAAGVVANGTTIFLKMRVTRGTGSNATIVGSYSSTGQSGSWTALTASNNGTETAQPGRLYTRNDDALFIVDTVKIAAEDINF